MSCTGNNKHSMTCAAVTGGLSKVNTSLKLSRLLLHNQCLGFVSLPLHQTTNQAQRNGLCCNTARRHARMLNVLAASCTVREDRPAALCCAEVVRWPPALHRLANSSQQCKLAWSCDMVCAGEHAGWLLCCSLLDTSVNE